MAERLDPNDQVVNEAPPSPFKTVISETLGQTIQGINEFLGTAADAIGSLKPLGEGGMAERFRERGLSGINEMRPTAVGNFLRGDVSITGEETTPLVGDPQTAMGRISRRTGEELGYGLPFAGGAIVRGGNLLNQGLRTGGEIAGRTFRSTTGEGARRGIGRLTAPIGASVLRPIQKSIDEGLETAARTPYMSALGEGIATAGAGVGAGVGQELAPGSRTAETVGQFGGGFSFAALGILPIRLGFKLGKDIWGHMSGQSQNIKAQNAAASMFDAGLLNTETINAALDAERKVRGFTPDLARATNDPALIATVRGVEKGMSGAELNDIALQYDANTAALDRFVQDRAPQLGDVDPEPTLGEGLEGMGKALVTRRQFLAGAAAAAASTAMPEGTGYGLDKRIDFTPKEIYDIVNSSARTLRINLGITARDSLHPIFEETTRAAPRIWLKEKDIFGVDTREAFIPELEAARQKDLDFLRSELSKSLLQIEYSNDGLIRATNLSLEARGGGITEFNPRNYPPVVSEILGLEAGGKIGIVDLIGLRERLVAEVHNARVTDGTSDTTRRLEMLAANFDDYLFEQSAVDVLPDRRLDLEDYMTEFQSFIDDFERGAVYRISQRGADGRYVMSDEMVADAFMASNADGGGDAARQYMNIFGRDPERVRDLSNVVFTNFMDEFMHHPVEFYSLGPGGTPKEFGKTGVGYDSDGAAQWIADHSDVIDVVPGLRQRLDNSDVIAHEAMLDYNQQYSRLMDVEDSRLVKVLDDIASESETSHQELIDRAVRDPEMMKQIIGLIRDSERLATSGGRKPQTTEIENVLTSLRRNIWFAAGDIQDPAQLTAFINNNIDSLRQLFTMTHLSDLGTLTTGRQMQANVPRPTGTAISPNPLKDVEARLGMALSTGASRIINVKSGRLSNTVVVVDALGRVIRGHSLLQSKALWKEALYNPAVAKALANLYRTSGADNAMARISDPQIRMTKSGIPGVNRSYDRIPQNVLDSADLLRSRYVQLGLGLEDEEIEQLDARDSVVNNPR